MSASDIPAGLPPRLRAIVEEFSAADRAEKLELLLEYSDRLPPLPEQWRNNRAAMEQVHECATPVYAAAESHDGRLTFHIDVPEESPTVRGYAALLREGLEGATPETVLAIPGDFFYAMGLQQVLSPQRLNGISYLLTYLKRLAARELAKQGKAS
ncbi:MAG: SufE family protein [Roseiflexaceae bacterium]|nr:SufE family protein [Roseiflexus sp.]MDW8234218.1 SufE family protein [Roseiflexaceae bacterium]